MARPTLSVVMPVYNVGAYLPACLDSLMAQTRPPDEIIAVDDGSTDNCAAILADYASRMPNLRVIRQANGGLSAARNTGLANASGDYLVFLDSDDFLSDNAYEILLVAAEADTLDMVVCNALYHFEGRQADYPIYAGVPDSGVVSGADWIMDRLASRRFLHMVWMHLYRRSFLLAHQFSFPVNIIHEDVVWTTRALVLANRIRYLPVPLIHYRIPVRTFNAEQKRLRLERIIASSLYNARELGVMNGQAGVSATLRKLLDWQLVDGAFSVFHKIGQFDDPALRRAHFTELRRTGFFRLLWQHAADNRQRRRIVGHYLRSWYR
jgi:glycosyltransferase involved in cell wall biosynthesis